MTRIPAQLFKSALKLVQPRTLKSSASYCDAIPVIVEGKVAAPAPQLAASPGAAIPKKLWTYWNHAQPDSFVRECIQSWRLQCPDYEVCLAHPGNMAQYVAQEALPARFHEQQPT